MRLNGELQVLLGLEGGGFDENGAPIPAQEVWSDGVPCHVKTNSDNELGKYEDGLFRVATHRILAEPCLGDELLSPDTDIARVKVWRRDKLIGEFAVMSAQRIETQNRFEILV